MCVLNVDLFAKMLIIFSAAFLKTVKEFIIEVFNTNIIRLSSELSGVLHKRETRSYPCFFHQLKTDMKIILFLKHLRKITRFNKFILQTCFL